MHYEFKDKWLAALRSGDFKQGSKSLCKINEASEKTYCCLGVGYLVATGYDPIDTASGYIQGSNIDVTGVPGEIVGHGSHNNIACKLANMNDSGKSFLEIADWIEDNIPAS